MVSDMVGQDILVGAGVLVDCGHKNIRYGVVLSVDDNGVTVEQTVHTPFYHYPYRDLPDWGELDGVDGVSRPGSTGVVPPDAVLVLPGGVPEVDPEDLEFHLDVCSARGRFTSWRPDGSGVCSGLPGRRLSVGDWVFLPRLGIGVVDAVQDDTHGVVGNIDVTFRWMVENPVPAHIADHGRVHTTIWLSFPLGGSVPVP